MNTPFIDDRELKYPIYSEVCSFCQNLFRVVHERKCKAFPNGIPDEIWLGKNKHINPYPGDNGIQFKYVKKENDVS